MRERCNCEIKLLIMRWKVIIMTKSYSNLNYWIKRHSYEIKKFIPDKMYLIF